MSLFFIADGRLEIGTANLDLENKPPSPFGAVEI